MDTVTSRKLTRYAEDIFQRTGLGKCIDSIYDEIEEEFSGSYFKTNNNDEDWTIAATYGRELTDTYPLIENGRLCHAIKYELNDSEQQLILMLARKQDLELSVRRSDHFGQLWSLSFSLPVIPNKPTGDTLELDYQLIISTQRKLVNIRASSNRQLDEAQMQRLSLLYKLKF